MRWRANEIFLCIHTYIKIHTYTHTAVSTCPVNTRFRLYLFALQAADNLPESFPHTLNIWIHEFLQNKKLVFLQLLTRWENLLGLFILNYYIHFKPKGAFIAKIHLTKFQMKQMALKVIRFQKLTQPQSLTLAVQHLTESLAEPKVPFFAQISLEPAYES